MISVMVLQNSMALLKGEPGSLNETFVSSILHGNEEIGIDPERVSNMAEEVDRESTTVPVIKTEPKVSVVPVVKVTHISYGLYPELPAPVSVCSCETKI